MGQMSCPADPNLSITGLQQLPAPASLPEVPPQLLDFGSELRLSRLLAIYRRGSRIFASRSALDELSELLRPQLERGRVVNDFEWKTLLLLSAAAFQSADENLRRRCALTAERCRSLAVTRWARMCCTAVNAQLRPALLPELTAYLDDLDHVGSTAAVLLSQGAYTASQRLLLGKAVARLTLYEEAYSFPGHPNVQYHLALAMQRILETRQFDEAALLGMLRRLESEPEQAAFRLGLSALRELCPLQLSSPNEGSALQAG